MYYFSLGSLLYGGLPKYVKNAFLQVDGILAVSVSCLLGAFEQLKLLSGGRILVHAAVE